MTDDRDTITSTTTTTNHQFNEAVQAVRENLLPIKGKLSGQNADGLHEADSSVVQLLSAIGPSTKFVLLGEETHGSAEFYSAREKLTKMLITKKGFNTIILEADWPSAYRMNRFISTSGTTDSSPEEALNGFSRFPRWMWRNPTIVSLIRWLKKHNQDISKRNETKSQQGFSTDVNLFGMDLYSLFDSAKHVLNYLSIVDPDAAIKASDAFSKFLPFEENRDGENEYGNATRNSSQKDILETIMQLEKVLADLARKNREEYAFIMNADDRLDAECNCEVVVSAEEYYRKCYDPEGRGITWSTRDQHMVQVCLKLNHVFKEERGKEMKAVVWAHNSHLGDARATSCGQRGANSDYNVGQLLRQSFGENSVFILGLLTSEGTVTAASRWGQPPLTQILKAPIEMSCGKLMKDALQDSLEKNCILLFNRRGTKEKEDETLEKQEILREALRFSLLQRAIGVSYKKDNEEQSHYVTVSLSEQFDAVLYIEETTALEHF
eukprot:g5170.t1